eukprot:TRINITY_DN8154_c0_g1_i6.p2 TRINITY_DN8154_c0_g1~~TRINITY_DN8154_c0_g1_i6.p2  ORF type:complete len:160 (+),score=45.76 TRINITY_DN8154_c0_g1_i6:77-556(+)
MCIRDSIIIQHMKAIFLIFLTLFALTLAQYYDDYYFDEYDEEEYVDDLVDEIEEDIEEDYIEDSDNLDDFVDDVVDDITEDIEEEEELIDEEQADRGVRPSGRGNGSRGRGQRRGSNFRPVGREFCKCCRYSRGRCVDMKCCQKYKAPRRIPTLNKPKN